MPDRAASSKTCCSSVRRVGGLDEDALAGALLGGVDRRVELVVGDRHGAARALACRLAAAAGAKLLHYYPVSTLVDGQGLNITVQSYLDTLDFGLVACRELVPDLWDMLDAIVEDLEGLAKAAGVPIP